MPADQTLVGIRMRDVCFTLGVAAGHGQELSRTQLQKFIYLVDVISPLYSELPPAEGHRTYKHGPYDPVIQNAADTLAFRGLVAIHEVQRFEDGSISARYALSPAGHSWLAKMKTAGAFEMRWSASAAVCERVNALGWDRLVGLVYAEPTFLSAKPSGFGQKLAPFDGLGSTAAFLMATIDRSLRLGFSTPSVDQTLMVDLFFRYLDAYDRSQHSWRSSVIGNREKEFGQLLP